MLLGKAKCWEVPFIFNRIAINTRFVSNMVVLVTVFRVSAKHIISYGFISFTWLIANVGRR